MWVGPVLKAVHAGLRPSSCCAGRPPAFPTALQLPSKPATLKGGPSLQPGLIPGPGQEPSGKRRLKA